MDSGEFRDICARIGISPVRFAELAGAAPGARPSWTRENDAGRVPPAVAALARVAEAVAARMSYPELAALLEREAAKLRG